MGKNWLIRSKSKQILGPVPLSKIKELIDSHMLKDEDEICSGNGHWIFVKEKDLVERYVVNGEAQGFNPISEAASVLGSPDKQTAVFTLANLRGHIKEGGTEIPQDKVHLPRSEDLEYPELPKKTAASAGVPSAPGEGPHYPTDVDLEFPTLPPKK